MDLEAIASRNLAEAPTLVRVADTVVTAAIAALPESTAEPAQMAIAVSEVTNQTAAIAAPAELTELTAEPGRTAIAVSEVTNQTVAIAVPAARHAPTAESARMAIVDSGVTNVMAAIALDREVRVTYRDQEPPATTNQAERKTMALSAVGLTHASTVGHSQPVAKLGAALIKHRLEGLKVENPAMREPMESSEIKPPTYKAEVVVSPTKETTE